MDFSVLLYQRPSVFEFSTVCKSDFSNSTKKISTKGHGRAYSTQELSCDRLFNFLVHFSRNDITMSYLRGSANYVWSTTCILGRGATATVYQGVNKKTGDPVAVKTFNKLSLDRPANVQMREFDVLRKVRIEPFVSRVE